MTPSSTVSVVVCTYQGAEFVAEQLQSIVEQSRPPDEVVIRDDASTDGTLEIIKESSRIHGFPFRICVNDQRLGHVSNFERVLASCTGDIVFLSDQDDIWLPQKIETMASVFEDDAIALVHCDAIVVDSNARPTGKTVFETLEDLRLGEQRRPRDVVRAAGVLGCTMAVRRSLVDLCLPVPEPWGHDSWFVSVASALAPVTTIPQALQYYRRHSGAMARNMRIDRTFIGRTRHRVGRYSIEMYEEDLRKWTQLVQRLEAIDRRDSVPDRQRFEDFAAEYGRRKRLAEVRHSLPRLPRRQRLIPVVRACWSGDYARYLRPVGSPAKDLLRARLD